MRLEKILNDLGFQTVLELEVGDYRIDVFVPELNCAFEYDGEGYHMKRRDQVRDAEINKISGLNIIRVTGKNLNPEYVKQQITEKFDNWEMK